MRLHSVQRGTGEPLLLIHGLGASHVVWEPVLHLLASWHDVNAPDLPGFGGSPALPEAPSPLALATALESHMAALGWETAHVVGNSLGGLVALELGRRGRARSVTAISPGGMARGWEDTFADAALRAQRVVGRLARGAVPAIMRSRLGREVFLRGTMEAPGRVDPEWAVEIALGFIDAPSTLTALDAFDDHDTTDHLDQIACPTTIAWGTKDRILFPIQGQRFKEAMPQARLVKLEGLGHQPMTDDPVLVTDVILRTTGARRARD